MAAELELRSHAVVDEQDAQITAHVAVAQGIHVVEKGEVARSEEGEALEVDQRGSQRRAIGSVDTTATYVAGRLHALRQGEHVPTAACVGRTEVEQAALGQARRELHCHPHVAEGQLGYLAIDFAKCFMAEVYQAVLVRLVFAIVTEESFFGHLKHAGQLLEGVTQFAVGVDAPYFLDGCASGKVGGRHLANMDHEIERHRVASILLHGQQTGL